MKKNTEIRIGGFGGQGIILAGYIIGKAAAIYDQKHSALIQSFGPEARGSSCSAQVIISESQILYPYLISPDISVLMSSDAYEKFYDEIKDGNLVLIEKELVTPQKNSKKFKTYGIPATRLAEEMGRKIVTNIIMVGFFSAITKVTSYEATKKAVETSVPKGTEELNLKAFETGYNFGKDLLKTDKKRKVKKSS